MADMDDTTATDDVTTTADDVTTTADGVTTTADEPATITTDTVDDDAGMDVDGDVTAPRITPIELHQFPRGPWTPNPSPFCMKLEMYLRMAKLPHKIQSGFKRGEKGLLPYITIGSVDIPDSQLAIEHCNAAFNIDLNKELSDSQRHTAHVYRIMVEEHMLWAIALWMWRYENPDRLRDEFKYGFFFRKFVTYNVQKRVNDMSDMSECLQADNQGLGRHSREVVMKKFEDDLRCLSDFLGDKDFMMGDEPCELDCSVFGLLSQLYWQHKDCPTYQLLQGDLKNLADYLERVRERFWPDWNDVITHGGIKTVKDPE